jgi:mRNA interferase RelE/StbE
LFSVEFSELAEKQLNKLEDPVKIRIISSLERIKVRPFYFVKKLIGSPYFRLRVGDYRLILDIKENKLIIFVIEIGHRRNIYK